jgi:hypothetical protein
MPVTAKLSRRFYERFGDELTNELVQWFNSVDAAYQSDLRELNEANFARFDAKLEQRVVTLDAKIGATAAGLDAKIGAAAASLDAKIGATAASLDAKIDVLEAKLEQRITVFESKVEQRFAQFETRLTRWMFALWSGTMVSLAGLFVAVLRSK